MMPAKKRTSQSRPPTSSAPSTSHASGDQHQLRHAGPSISTRTRRSSTQSKPVPEDVQVGPTSDSAPVPREKKPLTQISPSGARTSFTSFLYVLLFVVLLVVAWYFYGMVMLLDRLKDEVGWWGIIIGDSGLESLGWGFGPKPGSGSDRGAAEAGKSGDLEGSLNALADALGIAPIQVASAVKSLVPQASLTSMQSKAGDSEAMRILFQDTTGGVRHEQEECTRVFGFGEHTAERGLI